jgi:hypothetical protein
MVTSGFVATLDPAACLQMVGTIQNVENNARTAPFRALWDAHAEAVYSYAHRRAPSFADDVLFAWEGCASPEIASAAEKRLQRAKIRFTEKFAQMSSSFTLAEMDFVRSASRAARNDSMERGDVHV